MTLAEKRHDLYIRCCALYREKDDALIKKEEVSWDYDRRILILIHDILVHTEMHWKNETDIQRKASLKNIIWLSPLLRRKFKCIFNPDYATQGDQGEEINIWRNLDTLVLYKFTSDDPRFRSGFPISFQDTNDILQELYSLMPTMLLQEIRVGLKIQPVFENLEKNVDNLPVDMRHIFQRHDANIRSNYRDPHQLPLLEAFANYAREKSQINKILEAIHLAKNINLDMPGRRMAFLRQLQIIGEASTGKNISSMTKRLQTNIDWQLLIRLRNKLSHNEWDIHRNLLESEATITRLRTIQADDLTALGNSIQKLQEQHNKISTSRESLLKHYDPAWYARPATQKLFMDFIKNCYIAGVITPPQLSELHILPKQDIRAINIPGTVRQHILPVFDRSSPRYNDTRFLLPQYQALLEAFQKDTRSFENIENPDQRTQNKETQRLAAHQNHIRQLNNALDYTEDNYYNDRRAHPESFEPMRIINFIRREIETIKTLLTPLAGSEVIRENFSEDMTALPDTSPENIVTKIFTFFSTTDNVELQNAMNEIINYCSSMKKPLTIESTGLQFDIARGVMKEVNLNDILSQKLLIPEIISYGRKCKFYNALLENNGVLIEACYYHMARIQKYTTLLNRSITARQQNGEEFKALRNVVQHSNLLFEVSTLGSCPMITRYTSMFLLQLLPAIHEAALQSNRSTNSLIIHGLLDISRAPNNITVRARSLSF